MQEIYCWHPKRRCAQIPGVTYGCYELHLQQRAVEMRHHLAFGTLFFALTIPAVAHGDSPDWFVTQNQDCLYIGFKVANAGDDLGFAFTYPDGTQWVHNP